MIKLYQHQEAGKEYLLKTKKACLFFEVGTGKTFTALAALTSLPKDLKVLIVAPKQVLLHVWLKQTEYDLSAWCVDYINYEKISRDKSICKNKYDVIILDEVHKIKGRTTNSSKRMLLLTKKATYVWGLTGTPIANNYADVYNIYHNMNIIEFEMSFFEFCNTYYYTRPLEKGIYTIPILIAPRLNRLSELLERIGDHSMTKRAIDCIDLPEKRINLCYIEDMKTPKYSEILSGILDNRTMIKLESINKAHQAANGWYYDDHKIVTHIKSNKKLNLLLDKVQSYLEETDRVIVVYFYQEDYRQIYSTLEHGDIKWTQDIDEFSKGTSQVLLLQYEKAEGLNLQYCNRMVFYTYNYSYLKFDQMCGRIYRNGQTKNVVFDILINKNTIEEKIWKAISNKQSTDEYLKGVLTSDE